LVREQQEEQIRWLGKDFVKAYNRHAETGGLKAIGRGEAKKLLQLAWDARKAIQAGAEPKGAA
jgi:hypothetical protein